MFAKTDRDLAKKLRREGNLDVARRADRNADERLRILKGVFRMKESMIPDATDVVERVLVGLILFTIRKVSRKIAQSKAWYLFIPWMNVVLRARNSPERDEAEFSLGWENAGWGST